jgi:hypothetical protein
MRQEGNALNDDRNSIKRRLVDTDESSLRSGWLFFDLGKRPQLPYVETRVRCDTVNGSLYLDEWIMAAEGPVVCVSRGIAHKSMNH